MRVLIGCEFSGIVRDEFIKRGHHAVSCDLLPTERPGPHIQGNVLTILNDSWDLVIIHPECRYLNHAGVRWLYKTGRRRNKDGSENPRDLGRWQKMEEAAQFFLTCLRASSAKVCAENSEMHPHALAIVGRKADQIIQPWQFGHGEVKATHLWLKGLPLLVPTKIVSGRTPRVHFASPSPERWKERSRTLQGVAEAMGEQWG